MKMLQKFWKEEEGIATVEILLILAVLIVIAMLFRNTIIEWVTNFLEDLFPGSGEAGSNVSGSNVSQPSN